jgi:ABC-2 type transport system permease protein
MFSLVMLLLMLFAISLGVLVSTLARSLTVALLIMMAVINPLILLSGAWLPASYLEQNLGAVIGLNPLYQAMNAFSKIAVNGGGLPEVLLEVGLVILYIVVLGSLAAYLYEKRVTP